MRTKIVAGNWKMNLGYKASIQLAKEIENQVKNTNQNKTRVLVAPTFVNLKGALEQLNEGFVEVAAQNMHQAENGAFTGEISAEMLVEIGIKTVILGHSERRAYFNETDKALAEKVNTILKHHLETIFCFGEVLEDRKAENHFKVVESQLKNALFHIKSDDWSHIILAYEPVWAIGTGETATPEQAQEMHAFIRNLVAKHYGVKVANAVSILYGGSVKPNNAQELFSKPDVDGGLIGGAALNVADFMGIIQVANL